MPTSRLVRIREGRILGGVCTGLARYLNMDLTLVRIVTFLATFLLPGVGHLLYLVAWLAIPMQGADQSGLTTLVGEAKSWNAKRVERNAASPTWSQADQAQSTQPQETFNPYNS